MLFADRFPFVYLLSDYGIHYSAAFEGCTTDVDADFDTVIRLIHEADEHNVKYIAVTESSDKALAQTVISSTKSKNQKIVTLNSMQSVTRTQINNGATYLSIMEENINTVRTALGLKNKTE
jgi:zinc transport system substrate-binding protein